MNKPPKPKYKTTNRSSYNASLKERGSLTAWFDPKMTWYAPAQGKSGRQPTYSDAAIQSCLALKRLFGLALRQAIGLVESLLKFMGLDWRALDYSTLSRRQKTLTVQIPFRRGSGALHLLVDSTGIKMLGEGEWKVKKHGAEYRRQGRKLHLGIDANTLEIRAIEVTDNRTGDARMLPNLIAQISPEEPLASLSGDGAYDTRGAYAAIAERYARALIPPRKNGQFWKQDTPGNHVRNEALRTVHRLGRRIWKKWSGYHQRSLVETKMGCFKRLTESVMARGFDRQVAELQVCAAILNRFTFPRQDLI